MIMEAVFYSPPVIFTLFFLIFLAVSRFLSRYARKGESGVHALDSYACGQRDFENYVNPDYTQFFQYAYVFTIVHVLILVVATAPADASLLPAAYIVSGILAILIIFRR